MRCGPRHCGGVGRALTITVSNDVNVNGEYSFDKLPALPKGEHYTACVVEGPEGYEPTTPGTGERDNFAMRSRVQQQRVR